MIDGKYSILIIDTAVDFGGSIVSTANLIRGLDRNRFEPTYVSSTDESLIRSKLQEASGITTVVITRKLLDYRRLGNLVNAIRRLPSPYLQKPLIYALYVLRLLVNLPYTMKIALLIKTRKVDLVQLNNSFSNDEAEFVCLVLRCPRLMFFRGYGVMSFIERKLFLPSIRAFVSVSEFVKAQAVADGVPADKITVATPPAIVDELSENERAAVRSRYGVEPDEEVIGLFGRIVEWKGQKEFIRASAILARSFPRVKIFIVGDISDGDARYADEVRAMVVEEGLTDNVVFTGYVERVYELYNIMDVVAHTSIEPEPSGRVIFESMSCGVPVVASCLGGPKEFIEDGIDGLICDPSKPQQLADSIGRLLANNQLRHAMGARARAKISATYNKSIYAGNVERVYLKCLGA